MVNLDRVVNNLISLSENKYEQLKEIYLLTKEQVNAVEELDMEALSTLIDRKQERIDLIVSFDSQFEAIIDDLKLIYNVKSLDELEIESSNITILKDSISKVTSVLKNIIDIENSNRDKLEVSKAELEKKMNRAQIGKTALRQYSGITNYADAVFFDKKIK